MGLFDTIVQKGLDLALERRGISPAKFNKFLVDDTKKKEAGGVRMTVADLDGERGVPLPMAKLSDDQKYVLYSRHDLTGGIINLIRDALISIPLEAVPKVPKFKEDKRPNESSKQRAREITEFFEDPNSSEEGIINVRKQYLVDLNVLGRAVLEKNSRIDPDTGDPILTSRGTKQIGELWNLPAIRMFKNPKDSAGNLPEKDAYIQINIEGNVARRFDRDEVIWMDLNPLSHHLYGISPLDQLADSIMDQLQLEQWNSSFVSNNAMPEGILFIKDGSRGMIQNAVAYLQRYFGGATRRGRILVTDKESNFIPVNRNQNDMQFMEFLKWILQKYLIVYHLQPFVLGLLDTSASKATAQSQVQAFKDYCLKPILDVESYYLTQGVVKQGFGFSDVEIRFSKIDRVDSITQAAIDRTNVQQSIFTINEIRAEHNLLPVSWGDKPFSLLPGSQFSGKPPGELPNQDMKGIELPSSVVDRLFSLRSKFETLLSEYQRNGS